MLKKGEKVMNYQKPEVKKEKAKEKAKKRSENAEKLNKKTLSNKIDEIK